MECIVNRKSNYAQNFSVYMFRKIRIFKFFPVETSLSIIRVHLEITFQKSRTSSSLIAFIVRNILWSLLWNKKKSLLFHKIRSRRITLPSKHNEKKRFFFSPVNGLRIVRRSRKCRTCGRLDNNITFIFHLTECLRTMSFHFWTS